MLRRTDNLTRISGSLFVFLTYGGVLAGTSAVAQTVVQPPHQISVKDLMRAEVIGQLDRPLGTIVTIEGHYKDMSFTRLKADSGRIVMEIDTVDGKKLNEIVRYDLDDWNESWKGKIGLRNGERFRLIGFETGGFYGDIPGIEKYEVEQVELPGAPTPFRFYARFRVMASAATQASSSRPLKPGAPTSVQR